MINYAGDQANKIEIFKLLAKIELEFNCTKDHIAKSTGLSASAEQQELSIKVRPK